MPAMFAAGIETNIMIRRMPRTLATTTALLALGSSLLQSQPYAESEAGRFNFAQTYVGAAIEYGAGGDALSASGQSFALPATWTPRITVGGLHFWGHADFYVSFPLPQVGANDARENQPASSFSRGVETGARLFPWRVEAGRVAPFVGVSWNILSYAQQEPNGEAGPTIFRHRLPLHLGATWLSSIGRIDAAVSWLPSSGARYPLSRDRIATIDLPDFTASLGYSVIFDATASAEPFAKSGALDRELERRASRGELDAIGVGAGLSTAFTLSRSSYNTSERLSLDDRIPSSPFPDLSLGYYNHALDASANISFRPITQSQGGHGITQELSRTSLALEAIKFIGDYHGFTPFVGVTFGREWLHMRETDRGETALDLHAATWAPGLIAGWDIRPTGLDPFILRTNLRYTPGLRREILPGRDLMFDHLEVNFIQLILYPGRML